MSAAASTHIPSGMLTHSRKPGPRAQLLRKPRPEEDVLLVWRNAICGLDFGFQLVHGVRKLNSAADPHVRQSFHDDLDASILGFNFCFHRVDGVRTLNVQRMSACLGLSRRSACLATKVLKQMQGELLTYGLGRKVATGNAKSTIGYD